MRDDSYRSSSTATQHRSISNSYKHMYISTNVATCRREKRMQLVKATAHFLATTQTTATAQR